jgi:hypothetical protein
VNRTPSEEPPVHVSRLGSSQIPRAGPSESAQQAGGDSSDKSEYSSDSEATEVAAEATISVATWNIHSLASYKQESLLHYAMVQQLDVLAVCETHLLNSEQLVRWQLTVDLPDSQYCWFGVPAVREQADGQGRGSGGVGWLIRRSWRDFCTPMPACEHPCLLFVRLELPGAPHAIFLGVAYAVPTGCARAHSN